MSFISCKIPVLQCLCHNHDGRSAVRLAGTAYQSLSPEEQHGVDQILCGYGEKEETGETPEFIEIMLDELDRELGLLSEESKIYYTKAVAIEKSRLLLQEGGDDNQEEKYVGSNKFRLQFLRAELFDAPSAARRLVEYFQHKHELFGEEALARKIRHADLSEEDQEALVSGVLTHTGACDWVGRPIFIFRRAKILKYSVATIKRLFFYVFQKVVEDNETAQQKGLIYFLYHMNMPFVVDPTTARKYHPFMRMVQHGLPVRHAAMHIYYDDIKEHLCLNLALVLLTRYERARFLTHLKNSHLECMVDVMSFGINPDELPLTDEGDFDYKLIREYWERQRHLEEESTY